MEEALREKEERKAKEQQRMDEKERMAALRGLVGFCKRWSGRSSKWGKMYLTFLHKESSTESLQSPECVIVKFGKFCGPSGWPRRYATCRSPVVPTLVHVVRQLLICEAIP